MKKKLETEIKQENSAIIAQNNSKIKKQFLHASSDVWTEHEHIDLKLFESLIARLKDFFKFTIFNKFKNKRKFYIADFDQRRTII